MKRKFLSLILILSIFVSQFVFQSDFIPYVKAQDSVIFSDGFESGDFSAWNGTSGTPTIVTSPVHHGSYAMLCDAGNEYAYKSLGSSYTNVFVRVYLQITNQPPSGAYERLLGLYSGTSERLSLMYRNDAGTLKFRLYGPGVVDVSVDGSLPLNEWVCVEIEFDADSDLHHLWINGEQKIEAAGTTSYTVDTVRVGRFGGLPWTNNAYYDCVVVSDTYIGPEEEAGGTEYSFTFSGTITPNSYVSSFKAKYVEFNETANVQHLLSTMKAMQFMLEEPLILILDSSSQAKEVGVWLSQQTNIQVVMHSIKGKLIIIIQPINPNSELETAKEQKITLLTFFETVIPKAVSKFIKEIVEAPIEWGIIALGMAIIAFCLAATAIATKKD